MKLTTFDEFVDLSKRGTFVPVCKEIVADLLESRMIAPPRQRRRGRRAVSSRAVFYAAAED